MVLSLGLVMAAPAAANVSAATVTNAPQTVKTAATYTVAFTTTAALFLAGPSTITITFPVDTTVPTDTTQYNGKVKVNDTTCPDGTVTAAAQAVTINVPKDIPAGSVTVVIDKAAEVKNPTTVKATWKLTVKTSAETVAVDSAVYSTVAPAAPTLTVDITSPLDGASISVGQEFTVKAVVINTGPVTATAVQATISKTGNATVTEPLTEPVEPAELLVGGSIEVSWTVTCTAAGAVTIKVTPSGKYDVGGTPTGIPEVNLFSDQIGVNQQLAATLAVTAVTAPSTVKVGEQFTVTATVKNTGGATAKEVEAAIDISGSAELTSGDDPQSLGTIAAGGSATATWTVTCTAVGDATIKVTAAGKDANSNADIVDATGKSATVTQTEAAVLEVTISAPYDGTWYDVGDEITVTATVTNTGASTAKDVALTLTIDANAALQAGEVATKSIGYLAPDATSSDITWKLVCTAAGKSKITVSPSGKDVLTGIAIPAGSLIADSVTVLQSIMTHPEDLYTGWNLVSPPLIPTDPSIGTVLAGVSEGVTVKKVAYYTGGPAGSWLYYSPPPAPSDLTQMKDGKGYWIDVSGEGELTLTFFGVELALPGQVPPTYDVVVGWNLIGFTSTYPMSPSDYLGPAVKDTVEAIYGYWPGEGYYIPNYLLPGHGYWLAVNAPGKIYP
jgi:uncharacterized repeat protein (TIGR01451 family)